MSAAAPSSSRRPCSATRPSLPTTARCEHQAPNCNVHMINPHIFKAYDVRGLYPQELNEEAAHLIGRGFVAYLGAKRIAVSRDMRLSSPSLAAALIHRATLQGPDIVDYRLIATHMPPLPHP